MLNIEKLNSLEELDKYNLVIIEDLGINVNNRIGEVLKEKNIKPIDLSRMTGIARQNINDILKGKLTPGVDFALKISTSLNVKVEDLFELKETAWVKRLASDDEVLYLDISNLEIINGRVNKEVKKNKEYVILEDKKIISEEIYKDIYKTYYNDNFNKVFKEITESNPNEVNQRKNLLTKEKIAKDFNKICTSRYKKLGERIPKK